MNASIRDYWHAARAPRYSLLFAFPLLLLYEVLAFTLSHHAITNVRNGADVLLKSLFLTFGGRNGLIAFGALLVGSGAVLAWRDWRKGGGLHGRIFIVMAAESVTYALIFGLIAATLTSLLLRPLATLSGAYHHGQFSLATYLMISLGAGIYEELLFRVLLVSALAWIARGVFAWRPVPSAIFAAVLGAVIFSAFHYVGPYADNLELSSFVFRAIAGLMFSGLYLLRGFGITAWTHALYDIFLTLT